MKKYIKENELILTAIIIGIIVIVCFLLFSGDNDNKTQLILITATLSILVSLFMILVERGINDCRRRKQFSYLICNDYKSYSFEGATDYERKFTSTKLKKEENKVICKIYKACDSDLEILVSANDSIEDWEWRGLITMTSPNTGNIAYYHTRDSKLPENGINSFGYKRLTAFERELEENVREVRVMITEIDPNKNFGREVFVANINR